MLFELSVGLYSTTYSTRMRLLTTFGYMSVQSLSMIIYMKKHEIIILFITFLQAVMYR